MNLFAKFKWHCLRKLPIKKQGLNMSKRTISKTIDSKFYQKKIEKKVGFSLDEILEKVANFVPNSCAPYLDKNSFRLSENWRSISIQLKNDYYLTLKGTEVDVKDIGTVFDKVLNQYYMVGEGTNSDHFYYKEAKLPMLVTASEALTEYTVSMNIFLDYYNKFKIVPALPL